ncbi:MAG: hypothetical protein QF593_09160, partial [Nitrospinota bacterium]|nr:hypothetical protein [Nitrospinota bacterium]
MKSHSPTERSPEFVEVAVPIPVDRTFTYRAPKSMRDRGRPRRGERVRVPFGGRVLTGVVVAAS